MSSRAKDKRAMTLDMLGAAVVTPGNAPIARWTVYRSTAGRAHRFTIETPDRERLRAMMVTPDKRIMLFDDFTCHHLGMAVDAAHPMLKSFRKLGQDGSWELGVAPSWTYARSYGTVRWSLSMVWEGQGEPWMLFQHRQAAPITLMLEDVAFLYVALPIAIEGCARDAAIDDLRSDDVILPELALPAEKAGTPWSAEDEATVWDLWDAGRSIEDIAQILQRAPSAIASRFGKFTTTDR